MSYLIPASLSSLIVPAYGQVYMYNNATVTTIANTTNFNKILGTTTTIHDTLFIGTNNRLTYNGTVFHHFIVNVNLTFTSTANNQIEIGIYSSNGAGVLSGSIIKTTTSSGGRANNIATHCIVELNPSDYIEIHIRNLTGANNITVEDMIVVAAKLI
jgi:hypothetical protein